MLAGSFKLISDEVLLLFIAKKHYFSIRSLIDSTCHLLKLLSGRTERTWFFLINIIHKLELVNNIFVWENIVVEYWNLLKVYQHFLIFLSDYNLYTHFTVKFFFRQMVVSSIWILKTDNLKILSSSKHNLFKTFW